MSVSANIYIYLIVFQSSTSLETVLEYDLTHAILAKIRQVNLEENGTKVETVRPCKRAQKETDRNWIRPKK